MTLVRINTTDRQHPTIIEVEEPEYAAIEFVWNTIRAERPIGASDDRLVLINPDHVVSVEVSI